MDSIDEKVNKFIEMFCDVRTQAQVDSISEYLHELLDEHGRLVADEVISYIGYNEGWEETEDVYREHFDLDVKYGL